LSDLDGNLGDEVLFTNLNVTGGVGTSAQATILSSRTQQVRTFDVGKPNQYQLAELDGVDGNEVLFTNVHVSGGVAQPAVATVLTGRTLQANTYNVGKPDAFQVVDLDGVAGSEVLFTNLNSAAVTSQPAQATVLTAWSHQTTFYNVGHPNSFQVVELDGQAGAEVLFTNVSVVNGVPQAAQASVLTARTQQVQVYDLGKPTSMIVADLDGFSGNEVAFVGSSSIVVITQRTKERTLYQVGPVSTVTTFQFDENDGLELFVTRQNGSIAVVIHRSRKVVFV
jgi:DNA primase